MGIKVRSMDAREGELVRLSTLCLLRTRRGSGSRSSVRLGGGEDWRRPADGWRYDKEEEREAEAGYSGEWASPSSSSSSDRVRVCGTVLVEARCVVVRAVDVGDEAKAEWREAWSDSRAGVWCGSLTRAGLGMVRESMVKMYWANGGEQSPISRSRQRWSSNQSRSR